VVLWWQGFFDEDYLRLWEGPEGADHTAGQVAALWEILRLAPGSSVLDAPCGYGRISRGLAERGANVVGLDFSPVLLAEAEKRRDDLPSERLRYRRHDLREPIVESGFDAALNIFSSLGYGSEADDLAILSNLRDAVRPGGLVFLETLHRDRIVANLLHNAHPARRVEDGTLIVEEPRFDPVAGRVETTWYWSGPRGSGEKSASVRVYTATELVKLVEAAGLRLRSVHAGCSPEPFVAPGEATGKRLGVLAERAERAVRK
jgi:SAM-dependent methyltransferase